MEYNVLSLFDGMSCGQQALDRLGIYPHYFASEIDKYAMAVTQKNYCGTYQIGSVTDIKEGDFHDIFLLIGGSPCTDFSFAGKMSGMSTIGKEKITSLERYLELRDSGYEFKGQSYLFWEYVRVLKDVNPKYFLLENVRMKKEWQHLISEVLGVEPIVINSNLVSAQNRHRLYWTNIPGVTQPEDLGILLKDVLESPEDIEDKYLVDTSKMGINLPIESQDPVNLTEARTEEAKRSRREVMKNTGKDYSPRGAKELVPREDGKANTITISPTKSSLIAYQGAAIRGRGQAGNITQTLEKNKTEKANSLTTVQKDSLVFLNQKELERAKYKYKSKVWKSGNRMGNMTFPDGIDRKGKTVCSMQVKGDRSVHHVEHPPYVRRLTPLECERLQTVYDNYTAYGDFDGDIKEISNTQRYRMVGNGWTVEVIKHIFSFIPEFSNHEL